LLFLCTDSDKAKIQGKKTKHFRITYIKVTGLENAAASSSSPSPSSSSFFFFFMNLLSRRGKALLSSQKSSVAHPASYSL